MILIITAVAKTIKTTKKEISPISKDTRDNENNTKYTISANIQTPHRPSRENIRR